MTCVVLGNLVDDDTLVKCRHGSHLTKTTVGVSDTEADIKEEVE